MSQSFLARYRAGESAGVWSELVALGPSVRAPAYFDDAYAVARQTMRRVRQNVETIHRRLAQIGYQFWVPESAFVPPPPGVIAMTSELEDLVGPLPLSLRAFYEVVGSVDFRQAPGQLSHGWDDDWERAQLPETGILGEEDPLEVAPIDALLAAARTQPGRPLYFCFAADEFHKANHSGGENYHVSLPNPDADFRIEGMYDIGEYFVEYLRHTCAYGGFRGRVRTLPEDDQRCYKVAPHLQITKALASGLLPI